MWRNIVGASKWKTPLISTKSTLSFPRKWKTKTSELHGLLRRRHHRSRNPIPKGPRCPPPPPPPTTSRPTRPTRGSPDTSDARSPSSSPTAALGTKGCRRTPAPRPSKATWRKRSSSPEPSRSRTAATPSATTGPGQPGLTRASVQWARSCRAGSTWTRRGSWAGSTRCFPSRFGSSGTSV